MLTRKQYMASSDQLHHAYYLQLAQMAGLGARSLPVGLDKIREALKTDEHLNNIRLTLWDAAALNCKSRVSDYIAKCEESKHKGLWSLGDGVCILKALAKHLVCDVQIGTSYFFDRESANHYYAQQHETADDVTRKLAEGMIHIGVPPYAPENQRPILIDDGMRWAVAEWSK
jgi:hypothetical protein